MYRCLEQEIELQKEAEDDMREGSENTKLTTKGEDAIMNTPKRSSPTIIETISNLRGNKQLLREKILKVKEEAFLYKSVITLVDNVPMDGEYYTLSTFQYRGPSTYAEETME